MEDEQWIKEDTLQQQLKSLKTPGSPPSTFKFMDWMRKGLIPRPRGFGGRYRRREWHPTTAAEIYANTHLQLASGQPLSQIIYIRRLALMIESCRGPEDVLAVARGFIKGAQAQGLEDATAVGPFIVVWLRQKRKALRLLYGKTEPEFEKRLDEFVDSQDFVRLIFGLTNNFFDGYRYENNRLIAPEKKMFAEADALKNFPKAKAA